MDSTACIIGNKLQDYINRYITSYYIGSSIIVNADWRLPQATTMGLIGGSSTSTASSSADFVIITVIPYTGKASNLSG
ncbi:MAG: hypothetical protein DLM72_18125 [Candidatus Nitrosopolaris wilkensis]|nr:MAG: hypothetical protein DLM72_18125 [Candidatus Nitrosopolaris wilkensis]